MTFSYLGDLLRARCSGLSVSARARTSLRRRAFAFATCAGALSEDHDDRTLASRARAVVMHLTSRMDHERAGLHRHSVIGIVGTARVHPPRAGHDHDVAVVVVEVRPAESARAEPIELN